MSGSYLWGPGRIQLGTSPAVTAGGPRALTHRANGDLSRQGQTLARTVGKKVRRKAMPDLAFTALGQATPVQHLKLR